LASSKDASAQGATPQPVEQASAVPSASPAQKLDETIPGGSFIVNGKRVNAEGQRIHENGTLLTAAELAAE